MQGLCELIGSIWILVSPSRSRDSGTNHLLKARLINGGNKVLWSPAQVQRSVSEDTISKRRGKSSTTSAISLADLERFDKLGEFILRSPGIHLTVDEPLIYVTTTSDSLTVLRYQDSKLVQVFR